VDDLGDIRVVEHVHRDRLALGEPKDRAGHGSVVAHSLDDLPRPDLQIDGSDAQGDLRFFVLCGTGVIRCPRGRAEGGQDGGRQSRDFQEVAPLHED
jgi:hypothetical protein